MEKKEAFGLVVSLAGTEIMIISMLVPKLWHTPCLFIGFVTAALTFPIIMIGDAIADYIKKKKIER
jgi:hypothetical protein